MPHKFRIGPDGIHYFNRATGLNILFDEFRPPTENWHAAPRYISIALTNACELRCPYCYAPKHPATLDAREVIAWVSELDDAGCLGVGFGGGEPTLFRDFPILCQQVAELTSVAVSFTTHGHRINRTVAAELTGSVHFIRVSIDGVDKTYEQLRGRPFSSLLRRLEIIKDISPFGINYVVNARTLPEIDRVVDLGAQFGVAELLLLPEQPTHTSPGITRETAQSLASWIRGYHGPIPLRISEAGAADLPVCDPNHNEKGLLAYAHIDACHLLKRSSFDDVGVEIDQRGVMYALAELTSIDGAV